MKSRRHARRRRGPPPEELEPVPYHARPMGIRDLLWRQAENIRLAKGVFLDDLRRQPDAQKRRAVKGYLDDLLRHIAAQLEQARREVALYEPKYYDRELGDWVPLTVERLRREEELQARQARAWESARRRRREEREHAEAEQDRKVNAETTNTQGGSEDEDEYITEAHRARTRATG